MRHARTSPAYNLRSLFVGSEVTLGIITAIWLRFVPGPERTDSAAAFYPDAAAGCAAIAEIVGSGLVPAAVEYADAGVLEASRGAFPGTLPASARFLVLLELDGSEAELKRLRGEALDLLSPTATEIFTADNAAGERALWRWRAGMGPAVTAVTGGRVSEDVLGLGGSVSGEHGIGWIKRGHL